MKVEVNMINVEDGDAIILCLKKGREKALILIDGGYKKHYFKLKRRLEELLPDYNNKIDLIVCTHYDNDHLGGIEKVLDDYHDSVKEIWIQKAADTLEEQVTQMRAEIDSAMEVELKFNEFRLKAGVDDNQEMMIIEGYRDLLRVTEKLVQYNMEGKTREPQRGDYLKGFKEFSVISPGAAYYNAYLDELKGDTVANEIRHNISEKKKMLESLEEFTELQGLRSTRKLANACSRLEKSSLDNSVTAPNLVGIVTLLKPGNRKFLFTGDAGIESFEAQNILDDDLKNLDWLDLPHHGSKNNTSEKMLHHFNPKTVFVSGKGTANRPHYLIKECLKNKRTGNNIYVTNSNSNTWYLKYDENGNIDRVMLD